MNEMGRDFLETYTLATKNAGITGGKEGIRVYLEVKWESTGSLDHP